MFFIHFLPLLLFIFIYVGSGIYFSFLMMPNAFYQISPTVALIPAIALAWFLYKKNTISPNESFIEGARNPDILTMCIIFLLSGGFSSVTKAIGSVDAMVNLLLSIFPQQYLLLAIFFTSAIISIAIGSSMGTIATLGPIAARLIECAHLTGPLTIATVVGGAMFGDNLSLISDTTIAAVQTQKADPQKKFYLNAKIALIAGIITIIILLLHNVPHFIIEDSSYQIILILPYLSLFLLSLYGIHPFKSLFFSLCIAYFIQYFNFNYTILQFSKDIARGFSQMHDITILSIGIGGLLGLLKEHIENFSTYIISIIQEKNNSRKIAQYIIAAVVSFFDILFANNTIAIIFSGNLGYTISQKYKIENYKIATILDIFSCGLQGILPYGAQILLASSLSGISPLKIIPHVYYCFLLLLIGIIYISVEKNYSSK